MFGIGEAKEDTQIVFTVNETFVSSDNKVHVICFPIAHGAHQNAFALKPKQSYLRYGPVELSEVAEQRYCCIEFDGKF